MNHPEKACHAGRLGAGLPQRRPLLKAVMEAQMWKRTANRESG